LAGEPMVDTDWAPSPLTFWPSSDRKLDELDVVLWVSIDSWSELATDASFLVDVGA